MDIEKAWNRALKNTEIIRARIKSLSVHGDTHVPYVLLSESTINMGDTVVRTGEVVVAKPSLIVPPLNPQFKGFDFEEGQHIGEDSLINFLIVRGISLPSMKYDNKTSSLDIFEGRLSEAIKYYEKNLQRKENIKTGLIAGPEDCWQISLLIFICSQILKDVNSDIRKLLDDYRKGIGNSSE
ncbi:MAG: hypothetical protein KKD07_05315 [Candidatus Omnitrophica bacterium]|nr:hypothetical protein [Candidatus Omnitrophota bacterium]MBU4333841.1 hypothetical protein [Candidatus Omnitrophota bacterium]